MNQPTAVAVSFPPVQEVDFSVFGATERVPVARIQKLTATYLARNWVTIPHVTHHDEADISELEVLRKQVSEAGEVKITPLAFQIKALVETLKVFPHFNASLDASGENLILKQYFHIGIAVDTPKGLLVAVIRDCEKKSLPEIAVEVANVSQRARTKGLPLTDMQGGCMTISALGGIGGTAFTPIINAPEVAILGVTKAQWKPARGKDDGIDWRLMLPLDLSYDHRVINGADAARFLLHFAQLLKKPQILLEA
ncbi:2-oxo acid dehydrogenase subunit E2 [Pseudomonas umsongensis]|uniref:2-oxo acid dehydrogenase subunit E2 n=1 Tax=Pseudomonas umsongensis TaxID=198618 RepID=UPI00200AF6A8|nr:2-oxo acid dehydrogenase subunit E2 [Pseudomonas umsongensis]MCK8683334.1 2-oxo acid dehydrogenase subunit E2 [Pseudomonas umsongensis]